MVDSDETYLEYCGLRVDDREISWMQDRRPVKMVPRQSILSIQLLYGVQAQRPVVQVALGVAVFGLGSLPIFHFFAWLIAGGTFFVTEAWLLMFACIGGWLIYDALRRGYYLGVHTNRDRLKLPLKGAQAQALGSFLSQVSARFGYAIDDLTGSSR